MIETSIENAMAQAAQWVEAKRGYHLVCCNCGHANKAHTFAVIADIGWGLFCPNCWSELYECSSQRVIWTIG